MKINIKALLLGLLCSVLASLFIIGLIPGYQLLSTIIGVLIACGGLYYVIKHRPAKWFLIGFVAGCIVFTVLL